MILSLTIEKNGIKLLL